jgi:hypothetical protein
VPSPASAISTALPSSNASQCQRQFDRQTATSLRLTIPDLRRAMALALDRKAFIDILAEGQDDQIDTIEKP